MRRALCLFPKQNDDTAEGPSPRREGPFTVREKIFSRGEGKKQDAETVEFYTHYRGFLPAGGKTFQSVSACGLEWEICPMHSYYSVFAKTV